ncbi:HD-GYP domain-containing protein [Paenibacillus herberti]|uniref:Phosphohydrolase n=1 Tax=Paenibacillus herberti TaxID=1619309 RepID=A0A229NW50_9BACL|nr:HD-GYP domain-containing protein [Paenibacillus herberti]OXM14088.1 phosphohydrolase [Paenibacillus herberti]
MRRPAARALSVLFLILLLPLGLFQSMRMTEGLNPYLQSPVMHFYMVSTVAFLALVLASALGYAGIRLRNLGISFLSLAFISMTGLLMLHGLATPGFITNHSGIQGVSSQLGVLTASVWIWVSSLPSARGLAVRMGEMQRWLVPIYTVGLATFLGLSLIYPHMLHEWPLGLQGVRPILTLLVLSMLAHATANYWKDYKTAGMPLQLAIMYGCSWLAAGQIVMVSGEPWKLSWWMYHILLLFSLLTVMGGLMRQLAGSGASLTGALRALFRSSPQEWLQKCISPSVQELILATEQKDDYTAGHNYRVALYALKLGERMGLAPAELLAVGQGAIIHDVGKLYVPELILKKPGALTAEERSIVELHPIRGYELCRNLGFMREELSIIRSHHERWDGCGYPDQMKGEQIPLLARITAVADVYDALTSQRAYRQAMTHQAAIEFISAQSNRHFDPACVAAWLQLAREEPDFFVKMAEEAVLPIRPGHPLPG